jgi:multiple sugar transport system permease protein
MPLDRRFITLMLLPAFLVLVTVYAYPTAFNLMISFTDLGLFELREGGSWIGLANYAELLTREDFGRVVWNTTFWLTIVGVAVRIVLGLLLALLLNAEVLARYRLRTLSRLLLLVPWATPPIVAVIVWRWLLSPQVGEINRLLQGLGLVSEPISFLSDAFWVWPALITIITWNTLPLVTLAFLASLQSLPTELVEAARLDGAGRVQIVRYVILPHLRPAIAIMVLMSTFWTFNNFIYVWLTTAAGPGLYTNVLATELFMKAFIDGRLAYSSALGMVMAAIMLAFGLLYLRLVAVRELKGAFA